MDPEYNYEEMPETAPESAPNEYSAPQSTYDNYAEPQNTYANYSAPQRSGSKNENLAKIMFLIILVACVALAVISVRGIIKHAGTLKQDLSSAVEHITENTEENIAERFSVNPDLGFYYDDGFYAEIDAKEIKPGLQYFYQETGVKPFIYFFSEYPDGYSEIDEVAEYVYDQIVGYEYESHLVLAWYENYADNAETYYWLGDDAEEMLSDEDLDILTENISDCYYDEDNYPSYGDFLSAAFRMTAEEIR